MLVYQAIAVFAGNRKKMPISKVVNVSKSTCKIRTQRSRIVRKFLILKEYPFFGSIVSPTIRICAVFIGISEKKQNNLLLREKNFLFFPKYC